MNLPDWANWLARDKDEVLNAYEYEPTKDVFQGCWIGGGGIKVGETDDRYQHIKWTGEEPTEIKKGFEAVGVSVAEYERITNAMANGFSEVPKIDDYNIVSKPKHYIGVNGLEVETVLENFLPKITDGYVSHRIGSALEYILRHPEKNGRQDLEKAKRNLEQIFSYWEEME